jgi:hypothetical protein
VFVHYNGWGSRWDEWIPINSSRLATFRSHTVQNPRSNYLSPHPNITPDAPNVQLVSATQANSGDIDNMLDDMLALMGETALMIKDFKETRL